MVAIVAGNGLGLFNTSLNSLGGVGQSGAGKLGQSTGSGYVNTATGNLILQSLDEQLSGQGSDLFQLRTYNAQGQLNDDDLDGWRWEGERRVVLTGTVNTVGSTVTRTVGDGHEAVYAWEEATSAYVSAEGSGAHDSMVWDAASSEWVLTDGSSRTIERYTGSTGRLKTVTDTNGNVITYSYNASGQLYSVNDNGSGQELVLAYNAQGRLERLDTRNTSEGALTQQVYYAYDASGRLATVTTDLSPDDNNISDNNTFVTNYAYDGTSFRVVSITQGDGTSVSFSYVLVGGEYRVATVVDVNGTTTFSYDTVNRRTDVANGLNQQWSYYYDASNRLIEVRTPAVNGQRSITTYVYDVAGNVTQVADARGGIVSYQYDGNGNQILERDALGNTVKRTYDAYNQLQNEVSYSAASTTTTTQLSTNDLNTNTTGLTFDASASSAVTWNGTALVFNSANGAAGSPGITESSGLNPQDGLIYRFDVKSSGSSTAQNYLLAALVDDNGNYQHGICVSGGNVYATWLDNGVWKYSSVLGYITTTNITAEIRVDAAGSYIKFGNNSPHFWPMDRAKGPVRLRLQGKTGTSYNGQSSLTVDNLVVSATTWLTPAESTSTTKRYVYDANSRLRFAVDATGSVEESQYNSNGLLARKLRYGAVYSLAGLLSGDALTESQLVAWVDAQDKSGAQLTELSYDYRGNLLRQVVFAEVNSTGLGVMTSAAIVTDYVYSEHGVLLQKLAIRGADRTSALVQSAFVYDGLGRVLSETGASGITLSVYDGANRQIRLTNSVGLTVTKTYDNRGRLASVLQVATTETPRETRYFYDAAGQQTMVQDPTGVRQYTFYDEVGRVSARVDGVGAVTEYKYNETSNLLREIRYGKLVDTSTWFNGVTVAKTMISQIRPVYGFQFGDHETVYSYDTNGRVSSKLETGYVGSGIYSNGHLYNYDVQGYLKGENKGDYGNGQYYYYDAVGRIQASWVNDNSGQGFLTENIYDGLGRLVQIKRYATYVSASMASSLSQIRPASNVSDQTTYFFHDAAGRVVGALDEKQFLTEYVYDEAGNQNQTIRYALPYLAVVSTATTLTTIKNSIATGTKQISATTYDAQGRVAQRVNFEGTVTAYEYDSAGRLVCETAAEGTSEARESRVGYNAFGEVTGRLSGEVAELITAGMSEAEVAIVFTEHGVHYSYDAAGRQAKVTDASGNSIVYYYDAAGRLSHTVNGAGEVNESLYDALGNVKQTTAFTARLTDVDRVTLTGGLLTTPVNNLVNAIRNVLTDRKELFTYDNCYGADGRNALLTRTDAEGNVSYYTYTDDYSDFLLLNTESYKQAGGNLYVNKMYTYNKRHMPLGEYITTSTAPGSLNYSTLGWTESTCDAFGRVLTQKDLNGKVTTTSYLESGRVIAVKDPLNFTRSSEYDAFGRVLKETDALGNVVAYSYDDANRSVTVTAADGTQLTTFKSRFGETLRVVDALGHETRYTYNRNGQVLTVTDHLGNITSSNTYDEAARLLETQDASGGVVHFDYDAANRVVARRSLATGAITTYQFDGQGRQVRVSEGLLVDEGATPLSVTSYAYDRKGQVLNVTRDPDGLALVTSYVYDELGRQTQVARGNATNPVQQVTTYLYDVFGRVVSETQDPNGLALTTQYKYDKAGHLTRKIDPLGNSSWYGHGDTGLMNYSVDANNVVTGYFYDANGRLISTRRYSTPLTFTLGDTPSGISAFAEDASRDQVSWIIYDKNGRQQYTVDATGHVIEFRYDAAGRMVDTLSYESEQSADQLFWSNNLDTNTSGIDTSAITAYPNIFRYENGKLIARGVSTQVAGSPKVTTLPAVFQAGDTYKAEVSWAYSSAVWVKLKMGLLNSGSGRAYRQHMLTLVSGNWTVEYTRLDGSLQTQTLGAAKASATYVIEVETRAAGTTLYVYESGQSRASGFSHSLDSSGWNDAQFGVIGQGFGSNLDVKIDNISRAVRSDQAFIGTRKRMIYDTLNHQRYEIDALGYVTGWDYDGAGHVTAKKRYDQAISLSTVETPADVEAALAATNAQATSTHYVYDTAGRLVYTVDALRQVTRNVYDVLGQVTATYRFGDPLAAGVALTCSDIDTAFGAIGLHPNQSTTFIYDKVGRLSKTFSSTGPAMERAYDDLGHQIFERKYAIISPGLFAASQYYAYDAAGRLRYTLDAELNVVEYRYDANGNQTADIRYARPLMTLPTSVAELESVLATYAANEKSITQYAYDKVGQRHFIVDALGGVTENKYNTLGQLTSTIRHANQVPANVTYLTDSQVSIALEQSYWFTDLTNANADGFVVESGAPTGTRLENGRLVVQKTNATTAYNPTFYTQPNEAFKAGRVYRAEVTTAASLTGTYLSAGVQNNEAYSTTAGAPFRRHLVLFTNGTLAILRGNSSGYTTQYSGYSLSANITYVVEVETDDSGTTLYVYEKGKDRSTGIMDRQNASDWGAVRFQGYGQSGPSYTGEPLYLDNISIKDKKAELSPQTRHVFDKLGRVRFTIDALNYVTERIYDAQGNLSIEKRYVTAINLAGVGELTEAAIVSRLVTATGDAVSTLEYDALGRKTASVDSYGKRIQYGYDANGNVTSVTDQRGYTGFFYFDALNRQVASVDPEGYLTEQQYNQWGQLETTIKYAHKVAGEFDAATRPQVLSSASSGVYAVSDSARDSVTLREYDAANRMIKQTDAEGFYEVWGYDGLGNRVSYRNKLGGEFNYTFDALGRLETETAPERSNEQLVINRYVYDSFGNRKTVIEAEGLSEQRITTFEYDLLGHLTAKVSESVDGFVYVPGVTSGTTNNLLTPTETMVYDSRGNVILATNANGGKTFTYYDLRNLKVAEVSAQGTLTQWDYDAAGNTSVMRIYDMPVAVPGLPGGIAPGPMVGSSARETRYSYDKLGRLTGTTLVAATVYDQFGASYGVSTVDITTEFRYDANGNVIAEKDGRGNTAYTFYDKSGRKVLAVDRENYAITWTYGANTQTEHHYAAILNASVTEASDATTLLQALTTSADDRIIETDFDRLGRVKEERVLNVAYGSVDSTNGVLTESTGTAITTYVRDGMDHVTQQTSANGNVTSTTYDKLGREVLRQSGSYVDYEGSTVRQRMLTAYNGLGLVTTQTLLGKNDAITTDDRTVHYDYDKLGRQIAEYDALDHKTEYGYDAAGNKSLMLQSRTSVDGVVTTDGTFIAYNQLGQETVRQIRSYSAATGWWDVEARETRYNAYNEITGKRLTNVAGMGVWQEQAEYNVQGKVWRSNSGNGATQLFVYDRNGNATLQINSTGITDLSTQSLATLSGVTYTETHYDKRNLTTDVIQPDSTQTISQTQIQLFSQIVSRHENRGTFTVTGDVTGRAVVTEVPSQLQIQGLSGQTARVFLSYSPVSGGGESATIELQSSTTIPGVYVLDWALLPTGEYAFQYIARSTDGAQVDSGSGVFSRTATVSSGFYSGGSVTMNGIQQADPAAAGGKVEASNISGVNLAVSFKGVYEAFIQQRKYTQTQIYSGTMLVALAGYKQFSLDSVTIALPSQLSGYGEGAYYAKLTVGGNTYTSLEAVASVGQLVINIPHLALSGSYTVDLFKKIGPGTELKVASSSNNLPGTSTWSQVYEAVNAPPVQVGGLLSLGGGNLQHNMAVPSYRQLHFKELPVGTARVDVGYRIAGTTGGYGPLASQAMVINGVTPSGWFVADLQTVPEGLYDVMYTAYDATGQSLAAGKMLINWHEGATSITNVSMDSQELSFKSSGQIFQPGNVVTTNLNGGVLHGAFTAGGYTVNLPNQLAAGFDVEGYILSSYAHWAWGGQLISTSGLILPNSQVGSTALTIAVPTMDWTNSYSNVSLLAVLKGSGRRVLVASGEMGTVSDGYNLVSKVDLTLMAPPDFHVRAQSNNAKWGEIVFRRKGTTDIFSMRRMEPLKGSDFKPSGYSYSGGGFTPTDPVSIEPPIEPGWFSTDFSDLDLDQEYEFQYFVVEENGVVNRQQGILKRTVVGYEVNQSPLRIGGDGYAISTSSGTPYSFGNDIYFIDQASSSSAGDGKVATLRVRSPGGSWSGPIALSLHDPQVAGWFTWNSGWFYDFEYVLEVKNVAGVVVNKVAGKMANGQSVLYVPMPSVKVTVPEAQSITVRYGLPGAALTSVTLEVDANGEVYWDASAIVDNNPFQPAAIYYEYTAFGSANGAGVVLNVAHGSYTYFGNGLATVDHSNSARPAWVDIQPAQTAGVSMKLYYRRRASDDLDERADIEQWENVEGFAQVALMKDDEGRFRWDTTSLVPQSGYVNYQYFYELFDANGTMLATTPGYLRLTANGTGEADQLKWVVTGSANETTRIHRRQQHNAFGEVISETDGKDNLTELTYNTLGKLIEKKAPETEVTLNNGYVQTARPTTSYAYDKAGQLVASTDANGNRTTLSLLPGVNLETGESLIEKEFHSKRSNPDYQYDVLQYRQYDALGQLQAQTDGIGLTTAYEYDAVGNLKEVSRPSRVTGSLSAFSGELKDHYDYDEAGNRIRHTNALGYSDKTYYDSLGRVTQAVNAFNIATTINYSFDSNIVGIGNVPIGGYRKTTTDANGKTLIDEIDYFSRITKHTDLGGHVFTYEYDFAGRLDKQSGTSGQLIDYEYYANGYLMAIKDFGLNNLSRFAYDNNGNRTVETYMELNGSGGEPQIYQNANVSYDSLNRVKTITDATFSIQYEYDANDNIRHLYASFSDGVNGTPKVQDYWYAYDNMNRFVITMGQLSGSRATTAEDTSVSVIRGSTGVEIGYDNNSQRRFAIYGENALGSTDGGAHREDYEYTNDGYLETVKINRENLTTSGTKRATRVNDALGRTVVYKEYQADGTTVSKTQTSTYLSDNRLNSQTTDGITTSFGYMADGTMLNSSYASSGTSYTTTYTYEWWDNAKQSTIKLQASNESISGWQPGWSRFEYDKNGHVVGIHDVAANRNQGYINNAQGLILRRSESVGDNFNRYRNFFYLNGKRIGDLSNDGPSREDYAQALANGNKSSSDKSFKPISSADFDQNYEPISADYPGATSSSYVVNRGDTLRSISLSVWGDEAMWYLIADANGLTSSDELVEGQSLVIPNKVTNIHNNSRTFRPYNAGEAIGNTQPTLPAPPPPPKKKCNAIAAIVMVVVAVVATVLTAGAAAAFLAPAATAGATTAAIGTAALTGGGMVVAGATAGIALGTSAAIGAAFIGGAVGSAMSQLAGKAMGVVDHFSWRQVAASGLTSAFTAGMSGLHMLRGAQNAVDMVRGVQPVNWAQVAGGYIQGAGLSYGASYAANKIAGLDVSFSWSGIAASAVGSFSGDMINTGATAISLNAKLLTTQVTAAASAAISDKWFGGSQPDYGQVALGAFGNMAAQYLLDRASSTSGVALANQELVPPNQSSDIGEYQFTFDDGLGQSLAEGMGAVERSVQHINELDAYWSTHAKVLPGEIGLEQTARRLSPENWPALRQSFTERNSLPRGVNGNPIVQPGQILSLDDLSTLSPAEIATMNKAGRLSTARETAIRMEHARRVAKEDIASQGAGSYLSQLLAESDSGGGRHSFNPLSDSVNHALGYDLCAPPRLTRPENMGLPQMKDMSGYYEYQARVQKGVNQVTAARSGPIAMLFADIGYRRNGLEGQEAGITLGTAITDVAGLGMMQAQGSASSGRSAVSSRLTPVGLTLERGVTNRTTWINSSEIHYTQKSVSYAKRDEFGNVTHTLDDIGEGFLSNPGDPRLTVDVVQMRNGGLASVDNSRPTVLNATGGGQIQARLRAFDEPLSEGDIRRFTAPRPNGEVRVPSTWGEAAEFRIWKQGDEFMQLYPNGSPVVPKITGAPVDSLWSQFNQYPWQRQP